MGLSFHIGGYTASTWPLCSGSSRFIDLQKNKRKQMCVRVRVCLWVMCVCGVFVCVCGVFVCVLQAQKKVNTELKN